MNNPKRLTDRFLQDLPPGELRWIGLRPDRREPMVEMERVTAIEDLGLEGDRRCQGRAGSSRQVTLLQAEHLPLIAELLNRPQVRPEWLRRNLLVSGINLHALRHRRFRIGGAILEGTALCPPCSRMEEVLGKGGFAAMLGHGGICARILQGGELNRGDPVIALGTCRT